MTRDGDSWKISAHIGILACISDSVTELTILSPPFLRLGGE
ncbi:hypothetical protein [Aeromonas allosaccharophila]